ncbi:MAG TPA: XdhC family protein [Candidatus Coprousia avicola]|nr:XdhC family protein [Candidatus Coprousia avicola]
MDEKMLAALSEALRRRETVELASVVATEGSAPRKAGALLAVFADGRVQGTVGGGSLERLVIGRAAKLREEGASEVRRFGIDSPQSATGMICGGAVTVCLAAVAPEAADAAAALAACVRENRRCCLVFELPETGEPTVSALWCDEGGERVQARLTYTRAERSEAEALQAAAGEAGPAPAALLVSSDALTGERAERALALDEAGFVDGMLVLPIAAGGRAIIFGAGHVGAALVPVLAGLGHPVVLCDDRRELACPELHPAASRVVCAPYGEALERVAIGPRDQVVACTASHATDALVVTAALGAHPRFLGCLGSKKKTAYIHRKLTEAGFAPEEIARLHMPVGLPLGDETPAEIAISIAAQMIAVRHGVDLPL